MQILHTLFATATVFILNKYFTIDYRLKILISFSYFFFYEYNLVVRSYGLGIMLFFACIALYTQRITPSKDDNLKLWPFLSLGAILILLCNTSIMGIVLSASFMALVFTDYLVLLREKKLSKIRLQGAAILTIGFVAACTIGLYFIKSEPDNSYPVTYNKEFSLGALKFAVSKIFTNYFTLLPTDSHIFWNYHVLIQQEQSTGFYLGLVTILLFTFYFVKHSRVLFFYLSGTLITLAFIYYTNMRPYRYSGHLFAILIASYALAALYKTEKQLFHIRLPDFIPAAGRIVFVAALISNTYGASIAFYKDLKYPFSNFTKAGEYIMKNRLDRYAMMGSSDFIISPFTYYTHKPVYLPESKREQRFMIWDGARRSKIDFNDIITELNQQVIEHDTVLLILSTPLTYVGPDQKTYAFQEDNIAGTSIHMKFFHNIDALNIVNDERYYFYLANRIKP
jgi:hypothetical protein